MKKELLVGSDGTIQMVQNDDLQRDLRLDRFGDLDNKRLGNVHYSKRFKCWYVTRKRKLLHMGCKTRKAAVKWEEDNWLEIKEK